MPENPNEFNDDAYMKATEALQAAVADLWEAGATRDDIRGEFDNALKNVEE